MVEHNTIFGGLSRTGIMPPSPPTILQLIEQDFIAELLDELAGEDGVRVVTEASRKKLAQSRDKNRVLRLYQPVHRTFQVALLEIACDYQGQYPRLDPEKIDSAGLVVRRSVVRWGREIEQAWMSYGRTLRGWVDLETPAQRDQDPDPQRRPLALSAGHAEIDRRLQLSYKSALAVRPNANQFSESASALFVAPPDVSAATGKTILYGMIPVTSTERSEAPVAPVPFNIYADERLREHLSGYLKSAVNTPFFILAERQITYSQVSSNPKPDPKSQLGEFMLLLQQLAVEFNAFGNTAAARLLFTELNQIELSFASAGKRGAGDFLKEAKAVLIDGEGAGSSRSVLMPDSWPSISAAQERKLWDAINRALSVRFAEISPQEGRFDNLTSKYRLRAFVRVKREDGCPPALIWSRASEAFKIVPWYESGLLPPVQVALPSLGGDFLNNVKPNVSFVVPSDLSNILQGNDPKKMVDGEGGKPSGGLDLDWICGFNIPIITICAFIVLNIFLSLFEIIFRWMSLIKICIPFPAGRSPLPKE
ncbi:MAG TPA: hypothetical protein VF735_13440 [Pyrinomonadaceae bacterium]|jgi:hypothetical protein